MRRVCAVRVLCVRANVRKRFRVYSPPPSPSRCWPLTASRSTRSRRAPSRGWCCLCSYRAYVRRVAAEAECRAERDFDRELAEQEAAAAAAVVEAQGGAEAAEAAAAAAAAAAVPTTGAEAVEARKAARAVAEATRGKRSALAQAQRKAAAQAGVQACQAPSPSLVLSPKSPRGKKDVCFTVPTCQNMSSFRPAPLPQLRVPPSPNNWICDGVQESFVVLNRMHSENIYVNELCDARL